MTWFSAREWRTMISIDVIGTLFLLLAFVLIEVTRHKLWTYEMMIGLLIPVIGLAVNRLWLRPKRLCPALRNVQTIAPRGPRIVVNFARQPLTRHFVEGVPPPPPHASSIGIDAYLNSIGDWLILIADDAKTAQEVLPKRHGQRFSTAYDRVRRAHYALEQAVKSFARPGVSATDGSPPIRRAMKELGLAAREFENSTLETVRQWCESR